MIIQFEADAGQEVKDKVIAKLDDLNLKSTLVKTQKGEYLVGTGTMFFDIRNIGHLQGVRDIHIVSDDYKLVSRKWKVSEKQINLGDGLKIGAGEFSIMAGPCSIEGEENIIDTITHLKENNIRIMRGGVFKPRSSPYSFRGLGIEGLKIWYDHAQAAGINIISEVMQVSQIEEMYPYIDIFQVGARNTQNFNLLDELGRVDKPVMD